MPPGLQSDAPQTEPVDPDPLGRCQEPHVLADEGQVSAYSQLQKGRVLGGEPLGAGQGQDGFPGGAAKIDLDSQRPECLQEPRCLG